MSRRALIVDDSRTIRTVIGRIFGELGFAVAKAENGKQALDLVLSEPEFDVVLVDWNMPVMNGLEFVEHVRRRPESASTPILMVTTESETGRMVAALEAGVNEYLMKPFTREALQDKLEMMGVDAA